MGTSFDFGDKALSSAYNDLTNSKSVCTPIWMYSLIKGLINGFSVDELPDGYATNVGYGERFRQQDYSFLFGTYPILIFLIVLGVAVPLSGLLFFTLRCIGKRKSHHAHSSDGIIVCRKIIGVFILLLAILINFFTSIMLKANVHISSTRDQRAEYLQLAEAKVNKIYERIEYKNTEVLLYKFNEFAIQFVKTAKAKADFYLQRNFTEIENFDYLQYKQEVQEVLKSFEACTSYMMQFHDSWRYYDINATRFARQIGSMGCRTAIETLHGVRSEFETVTDKIMRQYRAYYQYDKALDKIALNLKILHDFEGRQAFKLKQAVDYYLQDLTRAINRTGANLENIANIMNEMMSQMRHAAKGFYIDFPNYLWAFGWFVCIIILLATLCGVIALPFSIWGNDINQDSVIFNKSVGIYLLFLAASLIFVFYLLIVLTLVFYFLYGMVAHDGICYNKHQSHSVSQRLDMYSNCLANMTIYDIAKSQNAINDMNFDDTSNDTMRFIERLQQIMPSMPLLEVDLDQNFERPQIDRADIEDIYVKMLQIAVYAPTNIESFGEIWYSNVRTINSTMPELVCAHAIGVSLVNALRGEVGKEVDKMYRSTWKVEDALQRMAKIDNGSTIALNLVNYIMSISTNLSQELLDAFVVEKEHMNARIVNVLKGDIGRCTPMARIYSGLRQPACACLVHAMNLFWFSTFVVILLLLPFVLLLLLLAHLSRFHLTEIYELTRSNLNQFDGQQLETPANPSLPLIIRRSKQKIMSLTTKAKTIRRPRFKTPSRSYIHPMSRRAAAQRWPVFPDSATPSGTRLTDYGSEASEKPTHNSNATSNSSFFKKLLNKSPKSIMKKHNDEHKSAPYISNQHADTSTNADGHADDDSIANALTNVDPLSGGYSAGTPIPPNLTAYYDKRYLPVPLKKPTLKRRNTYPRPSCQTYSPHEEGDTTEELSDEFADVRAAPVRKFPSKPKVEIKRPSATIMGPLVISLNRPPLPTDLPRHWMRMRPPRASKREPRAKPHKSNPGSFEPMEKMSDRTLGERQPNTNTSQRSLSRWEPATSTSKHAPSRRVQETSRREPAMSTSQRPPSMGTSRRSRSKQNQQPTANKHQLETLLEPRFARRSTYPNDNEVPNTSKATSKRGKVRVIRCPCGCGEAVKVIGSKKDIDRIKAAKKICIAGREAANMHNLEPIASVSTMIGSNQ